jgi:Tfp pilus assembly pilus retraction ATPase PilT
VVNHIRQGDFKKIDQELETGWKRGMFNFETSLERRRNEGFSGRSMTRKTGLGWEESREYLAAEKEIAT